MQNQCRLCGSSQFRLSRLRLTDISNLISLHYPVRCLQCNQRGTASLFWVLGHVRKRGNAAQPGRGV